METRNPHGLMEHLSLCPLVRKVFDIESNIDQSLHKRSQSAGHHSEMACGLFKMRKIDRLQILRHERSVLADQFVVEPSRRGTRLCAARLIDFAELFPYRCRMAPMRLAPIRAGPSIQAIHRPPRGWTRRAGKTPRLRLPFPKRTHGHGLLRPG